MKIIRASHLGMCFGVRDAIALAKQTATLQPVTVLGELVHNRDVLLDLSDHNIGFADHPEDIRAGTIMITAHGASDQRIDAARATGLPVMEATCPLVHHAHRELRGLVLAGYHPVIIGQRGHVEVHGLTEDLEHYDVVLGANDVVQLQPREKFGVIAQTTQPLAHVHSLMQLIRRRFPTSEVEFRDTVCRPTKDRQTAAEQLSRHCDVVIVIGGNNSNNTRALVSTCSKFCHRVHHIQNALEIREQWFQPDDTVGITAGTSTPDSTVDEVERALHALPSNLQKHQNQERRKHELSTLDHAL